MTDSLPKPSTILGGILLTLLIMLVLSTGIEMLALRPLIPKHFEVAYFIDRTFYWASIAVLWLFATKVEKQHLLIWKDNRYSIGTLLSHLVALLFITVICVYLAGFLISWMTHEGPSKLAPKVAEFLRDKMFLLFFTALTAGVTEEIIFRGYLQTRLEQLLKNPYWAIFISSLIFGLVHFRYGTIKNMVGPFVIGLVLATYYWRYRNIKVTITLHFLWDFAGLLILIWYHSH